MIWKLYVLPIQVLFDLFRWAADRHPVMSLFVGITDDRYRLHASKGFVEEVNCQRPSPEASFKALQTGEPFLCKLHAPRHFIVGGQGTFRVSDTPPPKCQTGTAARFVSATSR
jgi:putative restriction endonuclease